MIRMEIEEIRDHLERKLEELGVSGMGRYLGVDRVTVYRLREKNWDGLSLRVLDRIGIKRVMIEGDGL